MSPKHPKGSIHIITSLFMFLQTKGIDLWRNTTKVVPNNPYFLVIVDAPCINE